MTVRKNVHEHADAQIKKVRGLEHDRAFVRKALRRGIPLQAIEDRLLLTTEFHRLNPDADSVAYVRALIAEEEGSGRAVYSGDLTMRAAPEEGRLTDRIAKEAFQPETEAQRYIRENFESDDWLAVVVRNRESGETVQRVTTAQRISTHEFQAWLRYKNANGSDVYMSLNTLKEHSNGRTKSDLKNIRHLYLDLDKEGRRRLAAVYESIVVPPPNYVFETSPGKYQVVWRIENISQHDAEDLLRGLAQTFGGDPAATDATRVFRLPGFRNKKYSTNYSVKLAPGSRAEPVHHRSDFRIEPIAREPTIARQAAGVLPNEHGGDHQNTQSEKDWAYAVRHLRRGDDPKTIVREIAAYRSPNTPESASGREPAGSRKTESALLRRTNGSASNDPPRDGHDLSSERESLGLQ